MTIRKKIMNEAGAVEELASMMTKGTPRGQKDAVMVLFNLSTHPKSLGWMLESSMVVALIESSAVCNDVDLWVHIKVSMKIVLAGTYKRERLQQKMLQVKQKSNAEGHVI
jgi:hypothetical protein